MELLLLFAVLLLLFGATRLPQLGSSVGQAIRNFKKGFTSEDDSTPGSSSGDAKGASSDDAKKVVAIAEGKDAAAAAPAAKVKENG